MAGHKLNMQKSLALFILKIKKWKLKWKIRLFTIVSKNIKY